MSVRVRPPVPLRSHNQTTTLPIDGDATCTTPGKKPTGVEKGLVTLICSPRETLTASLEARGISDKNQHRHPNHENGGNFVKRPHGGALT